MRITSTAVHALRSLVPRALAVLLGLGWSAASRAQPVAPPPGLTLGQAVAFALDHHPSLRVRRALEAQTAGRTEVLRAGYLPQVELAVGESVTVLVLRNLEPLGEEDRTKLRAFADRHGIQWWLQPKGPDTAHPFHPESAPALDYRLPEFGLSIGFGPTEFTQVNAAVNRVLVRRAVDLLDPRAGERVGDLFCGLGNFTLALASRGATVVGMEGLASLVARAEANARANGLEGRASFIAYDLYTDAQGALARLGRVDKLLIDPPRDGAVEICKALPDSGAPTRIVYVSCSPSTLARDAGVLVNVKGYRLLAAGVVNMFPHTGHVESIAVFDRL